MPPDSRKAGLAPRLETAEGFGRHQSLSRVAHAKQVNPTDYLIAQLDTARDRLDRDTKLLQWSLDLREQLQWGFDPDLMTAEVDAFKRAVMRRARR